MNEFHDGDVKNNKKRDEDEIEIPFKMQNRLGLVLCEFSINFVIKLCLFIAKECISIGKIGSMCPRSRGGLWPLVGVVLLAAWVCGSEFPERECCDPVYPLNTATTAAAPVTSPVSRIPGKSVVYIHIR